MKTYITGANGFIGKYLFKVLNNPISLHHDNLYFDEHFDYFYFLSSYGNLATQSEVDLTIKANLTDLLTVLNNSDLNFKSFVYFSSSSVALLNQTAYSRSKRAAEEVLISYIEAKKLPICIIRPFSVTGVGEQSQHLIPTLIRSCFTGELVKFVPEPTHDFIDVSDVVNGTLNLSLNGAKGIFELGNGSQYTNAEVLEIVEGITGRKSNIKIVKSLRSYDTSDWVSTNFKSRTWGWTPLKSLHQSIKEMVNDYKQHEYT